MPTLNLNKKDRPKVERNNTDNRQLRQTAYNNTTWRKLRNTYLRLHPLCELCQLNNKITPATDVHHVISPFKNGEINYSRLLDVDNLQALCKDCHGSVHANQQGHITNSQIIEMLDNLLK